LAVHGAFITADTSEIKYYSFEKAIHYDIFLFNSKKDFMSGSECNTKAMR